LEVVPNVGNKPLLRDCDTVGQSAVLYKLAATAQPGKSPPTE
jgi:hypothetical protein